jgi:flagellar M-ring protein FliF
MGFNAERGDSINVVNTPFAQPEQEAFPDVPVWKQPAYAEYIDIAKTAGKYLLMALALFILYTKAAKPMLKTLSEAAKLPPPSQNPQLQHAGLTALPGQRNYADNLSRAQSLANQDPRVVANIVKTWVGSNE